jgi:hypothetical protein
MGHHVAAHKGSAAQEEEEGALGCPLGAGGQGGVPRLHGGATYPFPPYKVEPLHLSSFIHSLLSQVPLPSGLAPLSGAVLAG